MAHSDPSTRGNYLQTLVVDGSRQGLVADSSFSQLSDAVAFHQPKKLVGRKDPGQVRETVVPEMEPHGPIEACIIDDMGLPKQGKHSVGVAR